MERAARIDSDLVQRIRASLARHARHPEVAVIRARIETAHAQAHAALAGDPAADLRYAPLAWAKTLLDAPDDPLPARGETRVTPSGALAGFGTYEELDPGWLETLAEYLDHLLVPRPPFGRAPRCLEVAEQSSLAIAGDWATGYWQGAETAAARVARLMRAARYTIHLGDTYYAGTRRQVEDHLATKWPAGRCDRFALPGNHEMYTKARPLRRALRTHFPRQRRTTFFALRNVHWLVLALDTAYFASDMYLEGTLGPPTYRRWLLRRRNEQRELVRELIAARGRRRVILLTHHPPIELDGKGAPRRLESEVLDLFDSCRLPGGPDYWAWGHFHAAAAYRPRPGRERRYTGRLVGHGGIPFGDASALADRAVVDWHETRLAGDPEYPQRVMNGFLRLDLDGRGGVETFVAEDGSEPFSAPL